MIIFPAIDIIKGEAVRLYKGDYDKKTVYGKPLEIAKNFLKAGATHIHIVDLDGAKSGETPNLELICKIKAKTGLFIEVGGGVRSENVIEKYLSAGIDRVILGTIAVKDPAFVKNAVKKYGDRIVVGIDVKDGVVAVKGWTEKTEKRLIGFCAEMVDIGVKTVICTDISKDGALIGTNAEMYKGLSEKFPINFIASGGVSSIDDINALKKLGLYGAIIGKAYYTGDIDLKKAIEIAK
ncbi:MAG: 1-(5-phosphoribosyl)-5-[(5-phosphoribosylamino)methylideneamino]imidazole-4-carboxamide isomerase [Clostridia bacterium]|nr:1-(5-phosphoribosyl)-5-[(5-phosphoribosylamino)methylideneamino]imidazole-4-carboxamide isomerase [Clostridia bacterium]